MAEKKNALAELAERLKWHDCHDDDFYTSVEKAQRIVEELAKVKDVEELGIVHVREDMAIDAVENCRAIAEEGLSE